MRSADARSSKPAVSTTAWITMILALPIFYVLTVPLVIKHTQQVRPDPNMPEGFDVHRPAPHWLMDYAQPAEWLYDAHSPLRGPLVDYAHWIYRLDY